MLTPPCSKTQPSVNRCACRGCGVLSCVIFGRRGAFWTPFLLRRDDHLERCHQGLSNRPIEGVPKPSAGVVLRR